MAWLQSVWKRTPDTPPAAIPAGGSLIAALVAPPADIAPAAPVPGPAAARQAPKYPELEEAFARHNGAHFLYPVDLAVTEMKLRRVAVIGSCFMQAFRFEKTNPSGCKVDLFVSNNAANLPDWPGSADDPAPYDFQIVQIGLRFVVPDIVWEIPYGAPDAYQLAFDSAVKRLAFQLERRMVWNVAHGLTSFVCNFTQPQRNPMGALFARYDLRNPEYFVARLNEELERIVFRYGNAHVLDLDRISASFGRRFGQDDVTAPLSHGSLTGLPGVTGNRIEPIPPMTNHFLLPWREDFTDAVWNEAVGMYRTLRGTDAVKMVVVDLDDTLWTGVIGEMDDPGPEIVAGWQSALAEALRYVRQRGILLGVLSKNEESRIRALWPKVFGSRLLLEDFAMVRINWQPKPANMRAMLAGVNLLPRNVVFIDDNPAERDAMQRAFPDMRVLGRHPYYLRHTLLWAAEMQVPALTQEGARRTQMVQAQLKREDDKAGLTEAAFLAAAAPVVTCFEVGADDKERFARVHELINKTNQFNTTGRRWTPGDWAAFFAGGGRVTAFEVTDAYTQYGLVGVVLTAGPRIEQFVMSCRVLGYGIEQAVLARLAVGLRKLGDVSARLVETDANFPCRELYGRAGFVGDGEIWTLARAMEPPSPSHVTLR